MVSFDEVAAAPAPPPDRVVKYGLDPLQFGELRLPQGAPGKRPVVVLLHGGCWQSAYDIKHLAAAAASFAREGYVVWTPEYRRVGDAGGGWPGTFTDVALAVDYLRVLAAAAPSVDTTRVVLVGHSAGGQLALWVASRNSHDTTGDLAAANRAPLRVTGVVSLAGITDLAAYGAARGGCQSAVTPLMGGTPAQVGDRYRAVNPTQRLPLGVPVRLVHGVDDPIVPVAQSRRYLEQARAAGDRVELTEISGAGHFDVVGPMTTAWPAVLAAVRALVPPMSVP